jgi:arylsulfatase A-like enzyme
MIADRAMLMRTEGLIGWGVIAALLLALTAAPVLAGDNVLLIVIDDLGQGEMLAHEIPTPNLDRLAGEGVTVAQGYSSAPMCGPTRAGLVTGRYSQRFGFYTNGTGATMAAYGLPPSEVTLAERLHNEAGYATGLIGKWHLGYDGFEHPQNQGFDEFYGFLGGSLRYFDPGPILRGRVKVTEPEYLTRAFGREAVDFIRRHAGESWFLELAFNAVHVPNTADPTTINRCGRFTDPRKTLCSMLASVDDEIGDVLAELMAQGLRSSTLVAVVADNGCTKNQRQGCISAPFRGAKFSYFEGGSRVPFIISRPGVLPQGARYRHWAITTDLFSTAVAAAGLPVGSVDGVNLVPFLVSNTPAHKIWHWGEQGNGATRNGNWKLWQGDGNTMLFNLATDPGEHHDVAGANPSVVADLRVVRSRWLGQMPPPRW